MPYLIFVSLIILTLSVLSGWLYHLGGINSSKRPQFFPLKQKPRDLGCSLVVLGCMGAIGITTWWAYLAAFALTWGGLATYWDWFPLNKGKDNFWMHGFFCGLTIWSGSWIPLVARAFTCAIAMGLWSLYTPSIGDIEEARVEEFGRGFILIITILFYLFM